MLVALKTFSIISFVFLRGIWTELFKAFTILYKDSVRTSQETHYVSTTKTNRLMLFGETVAVYCENHTEHTDTLCGHNASK
jgi:hypothetical protein